MVFHYSPLRYPGGKGCIFSFVSKLFYENDLIGISYAEPYAGGSGLALRLLFEGYVSSIHINDFDRAIFAFWDAILNDTDNFCRWVSNVSVDIENWRHYKSVQTNPDEYNSFELAKSTFFLNRTNISGVIKGGIIGGINQTGKYKINARFNKQDLIARIERIASKRSQINLSNRDGVDFIKKVDKLKSNVFIYLDPPYLVKGADLYMNYYTKKDHQTLSKHVNKLRSNWMVSYDNHDFILNLYATHQKVCYKLSQCASNRIGDEILVFSKDLVFQNSLEKLQSPFLV